MWERVGEREYGFVGYSPLPDAARTHTSDFGRGGRFAASGREVKS